MNKKTKIEELDIANKRFSSMTLQELVDFEKRVGFSTGVESIDRGFGFPVGYYVILGNPGSGKSWFAIWLSRVAWKYSQIKSVYFSLEMPKKSMIKRLLQQWSDLTLAQLDTGWKTTLATNMLQDDVIVVDTFAEEDTSKQTTENFTNWISEYYRLGYRIFHFDHLHELDGAGDNTKNQGVTEKWAKCFQELTKTYPDIWLFIYAQPNGAAAKKSWLTRTDIAGSKAITQKCDYVLSLNRKIDVDEKGMMVADGNDRQVRLLVDKSRYTETSHIAFPLFFEETGNFRNWT